MHLANTLITIIIILAVERPFLPGTLPGYWDTHPPVQTMIQVPGHALYIEHAQRRSKHRLLADIFPAKHATIHTGVIYGRISSWSLSQQLGVCRWGVHGMLIDEVRARGAQLFETCKTVPAEQHSTPLCHVCIYEKVSPTTMVCLQLSPAAFKPVSADCVIVGGVRSHSLAAVYWEARGSKQCTSRWAICKCSVLVLHALVHIQELQPQYWRIMPCREAES